MSKCLFIKAWCGRCTKDCGDSGYCEEHGAMKCVVCGEQATHDCDYTGQFVCGFPLCANCEGRELRPDDEGYTTSRGLGWGFMNHVHKRKAPSPLPTVEGEEHNV